jgi:hypothetical protein
MYSGGHEFRRDLGRKGLKHIQENYAHHDFEKLWVDTMLKVHEECGSWETRKGYNGITFKEIA